VPLPFYTIGHSTRALTDFVALLQSVEVALVADIRRIPRSRTNPQFNTDTLPASLAPFGIDYEHIAALGGRRSRTPDAPAGTNDFWSNASFRNYADYASTAAFQTGLRHLLALGRERTCAIMCSEAVWWRCHRRIVADYLLAGGETVIHIMGQGRLEPARLTAGARVQPDGTLAYPATVSVSERNDSPRLP
jgi:uncharacterized protein (DUF488 family)